ncbi:MAG: glutamine--tRNA ligase/YqeY domain fusion protein [Candidatus Alcyoniella australis]|nr:glutamine--tRNA ligase/YqeY domain fusion protein [Candidatus Alcyoniella australis]
MCDHGKESVESAKTGNFITEIIDQDLAQGKNQSRVATRFPPEPNGYLHIGHAKSICLNFGLAKRYNGTCNLRFDDTNPITEETEYVESIKQDVRWLGFDWDEREFYASDYFDQLYQWALVLINKGLAYIDQQTPEQIKQGRGDYYRKAVASPYRERPIAQTLELFEKMRQGEFKEGECVLRAKVDLESANINMRDPIIYRVLHQSHHRTGDKWCIYPMYDFAHGESDAIEKITHSICTLEFEDHRPLYDWFTSALELPDPPRQIEFARLNLSHTVVSKRKLLQLVEDKVVDGWDDPRMPTVSGLRRRGYTAEAIRNFCERIGVAKRDSMVDVALLEHCLREDLNVRSPRLMAVLDPLKVVITNIEPGQVERFDAPFFPEDFSQGSRELTLTREIFVERDDFREEPPRKWRRLTKGSEVRLRYACLITCNEVVHDEQTGEVIELRCTWDPESRGGNSPDGRKVRGTLHWVSADYAKPVQVRLYDRLFMVENPLEAKGDFKETLNPDSLQILDGCLVEPFLAQADLGELFQFERLGYFCVDTRLSGPGKPVFNRTVTLRDSWAKIERKQG